MINQTVTVEMLLDQLQTSYEFAQKQHEGNFGAFLDKTKKDIEKSPKYDKDISSPHLYAAFMLLCDAFKNYNNSSNTKAFEDITKYGAYIYNDYINSEFEPGGFKYPNHRN